MQTHIVEPIKQSPEGREADAILRKCVHCGFCLATCPTYSISKNELESPRGRIYLIKQLLEGNAFGAGSRQHLDSCLNCRACETTCPASVPYHRLLDIGTRISERELPRSFTQRLLRKAILATLPYPQRFTPALRSAQLFKTLLPTRIADKIPARQSASPRPPQRHRRRMLILEGCVQPGIAPDINAATARVLDTLGITLVPAKKAGCCGALSYHLHQQDDGLEFMRRNIDAWWPFVEQGCEAIVITASGCGTTVKEYGELLRHDPEYAQKANSIAALAKDLSEVLDNEPVEQLNLDAGTSLAFQCPCSLQHGQRLSGQVERLLTRMGFQLKPVSEGYLCCGSAGTYSIFQPELANELRTRKSTALHNTGADRYASANIGCITHLSAATDKPVEHWIQIVDRALPQSTESNPSLV